MLTRSKRPLDNIQIARFGAVGLVNTVFGYIVLIAALSSGAGDVPANAAGCAAGLILCYFLNSKWIFRGASRIVADTALRYAALFIVAYSANVAIVLTAGELGYRENPLVHLAAVGVYTALLYIGAARFVFDEQPAAPSQHFLTRCWLEIAMLCVLGVAWLLLRHMSVTHDVVWQMWIARQLLGGAKLYSDIVELNPPLWFWLAVPVQKVAQVLEIAPKHAMVAAVLLYAALAQLALSALIAELSLRRRVVLLGVALVAMVIVPIPDFAQREHLALIAAIPYSVLLARRADGRTVSWRLAVAVGLLAALGFALKHYFVVVPVSLELWLLWRQRRGWNPLRPELLVLSVVAILYVGAILLVTPDYISIIVPMVKLAYFGYEMALPFQLAKPFVIFWAAGTAVLYTVRKNLTSLTIAAAIAATGFVLCYFVQQKGWSYHAMPAVALLFLSLGSILSAEHRADSRRIVVGAMAMPILTVLMVGPYKNQFEKDIAHLLAGAERGRPVMMLAANPSTIWPLVEDRGYIWPSRHFAMWMLTAFAYQLRTDGRLSPEMQELAREVRTQTAADLECNPPDVILVDDLRVSKAYGIEAVAFFSEDKEFRAFIANYDKARKLGYFTAYIKHRGWNPAAPPAACRPVY
ncbi:MAG TPA: GtrA family protein [Dongiaceae bacterium]|jgi:putative flippase GtrA|nr:GtrA family protein [Dongiaceae bacterium]